jgi:hypothetical protein
MISPSGLKLPFGKRVIGQGSKDVEGKHPFELLGPTCESILVVADFIGHGTRSMFRPEVLQVDEWKLGDDSPRHFVEYSCKMLVFRSRLFKKRESTRLGVHP